MIRVEGKKPARQHSQRVQAQMVQSTAQIVQSAGVSGRRFISRGEALDHVFYLASNYGEKYVSLLKNGVALFWIYAKAGH